MLLLPSVMAPRPYPLKPLWTLLSPITSGLGAMVDAHSTCHSPFYLYVYYSTTVVILLAWYRLPPSVRSHSVPRVVTHLLGFAHCPSFRVWHVVGFHQQLTSPWAQLGEGEHVVCGAKL